MIRVVNNLRLNDSDRDVLNICSELKLSVSGVKYSRGHDADCMNANLKVGNKIKGTVWDDSWGGGFEYNGSCFNEFEQRINEVIKRVPKLTSSWGELDNNIDLIVDLLVSDFNIKKDSKKKTVFFGSKVENPKSYEVSQYSFNRIVDRNKALEQLEDEGFKVVEFV